MNTDSNGSPFETAANTYGTNNTFYGYSSSFTEPNTLGTNNTFIGLAYGDYVESMEPIESEPTPLIPPYHIPQILIFTFFIIVLAIYIIARNRS